MSEHAALVLRERAEQAVRLADPAGTAPHAALDALAHCYRTFAEEQPALYAALVTDTTRSSWREQPGDARKALWNLLLQVVGRLTGNPDDTGAAVAVWSFLHGFADLREARLFGASGPRDGFARGIAALAAGMAAR